MKKTTVTFITALLMSAPAQAHSLTFHFKNGYVKITDAPCISERIIKSYGDNVPLLKVGKLLLEQKLIPICWYIINDVSPPVVWVDLDIENGGVMLPPIPLSNFH